MHTFLGGTSDEAGCLRPRSLALIALRSVIKILVATAEIPSITTVQTHDQLRALARNR